MCGIVGVVDARGIPHGTEKGVRMAVEALRHRGPDDNGVWTDPNCVLGHTRLSIIDVVGGTQPMQNEDGLVVAIFNGEIWNYQDLRKSLIAAGHVFTSASDTEVLVHGYEEWGVELPKHLDGMFAFAVWDISRKRLLLARDRLGKKPLALVRTEQGLSFASDARAALLAANKKPELAEEVVPEFLFQRYVDAPRTLLRGVEKLQPGHLAVFESGQLHIRTYWQLNDDATRPLPEQDLRALLETAVERRLMSDVPLGALLSGGVDSALVASLMNARGLHGFPTFTIGFDNSLYDERALAALTARSLGTDHYELLMRSEDLVQALPRLVWARDEPMAEPSEIPLLLLAEFAARHVKVVLSGDGGDELFGGYPKYRLDRLLRAHLVPRGALRLAKPLAARKASHRRFGRALAAAAIRDDIVRWSGWFRSFSAEELGPLLMPGLRPLSTEAALAEPLRSRLVPFTNLDATRRMIVGDLLTYLPDNMLARGDKVMMAASLEGRMPLLDRDVVERVHSAPGGDRVGLRSGKRMLRNVAQGLVPDAVLAAGKKGFPVPVSSLLLHGPERLAEHILLSERALSRGLYDPAKLTELVKQPAADSSTAGLQLFTLLSLELWLRANVDSVTLTPPSDMETLLSD
jgi:asparagine synthase (glutamine-hydrolysing)